MSGKITETQNITAGSGGRAATIEGGEAAAVKKRKFGTLRAAVVCLLVFTLLCGVFYPLGVTLFAQVAFPYEANGSQIIVTLADGSKRVVGSELIGQSYESARYLFGRVNTGAPSNLSPESDAYQAVLAERIAARREKLAEIGYTEEGDIPDELLTAGGSGLDPHISPAAAYFQVPVIVAARNAAARTDGERVTEDSVTKIIDKYTEGRFLGILGEKIVNVLLVNLALDGLI